MSLPGKRIKMNQYERLDAYKNSKSFETIFEEYSMRKVSADQTMHDLLLRLALCEAVGLLDVNEKMDTFFEGDVVEVSNGEYWCLRQFYKEEDGKYICYEFGAEDQESRIYETYTQCKKLGIAGLTAIHALRALMTEENEHGTLDEGDQ